MVRLLLRSISFYSLLLLTTSTAFAQSHLDNPTPSSNQSGQGVISGWICNASTIEIVVDNTIRVQAPYGTLRGDTQAVCGDVNNGFGFQVNWNELGDGVHSLVVLADGNQFAEVTFTVHTLGVPVLTGAAGNYQIQGFAGKNVNIECTQHLTISQTRTVSPTPAEHFYALAA
jgi:lysyl endopeptidase